MNNISLLRVLLLEDSPLDAELIAEWLNSDGLDCRVQRVQARDEYAAALRDGHFDLLLSDYSLPGFDGAAALELAQELRPQLPFIFVSGHLGEELAIQTLKSGATDYVLKDRLERLVPAVKRALREAKERDARQRIETTLHLLSEASLIFSSLDYATTLAQVARLAVPHFADYCVVDVLAEDGSIERVAVAHADAEREPLAKQLMQYAPTPGSRHPLWEVLDSGRSQLLSEMPSSWLQNAAHDDAHSAIVRQLGICSYMIIPLRAEGRALGAISLVSASDERRYEALDLSLAEDLARRCAMAIENARLHRKTLESLRARDEFLAVLSHELRSPLTSILGWVHLLQDERLDDETRAHGVQVIERNTQTQVQLIEDLLEVSRIITGRLRLDMAPLELCEIVQGGVESLAPTWKAKGVEVEFSNRAGLGRVLGDVARLHQIVSNLLSNAIKFTPAGGRIEVSVEDKEDQVCLVVRDSGQGMAPEFVPYVFDRFRQADSSSTRSHGGLGLGLSIVRHIAELHGGTVDASSPGRFQGATFTVSLPLLAEDAPSCVDAQPPVALPQNSESADAGGVNGLKVLLVEDHDDARELLAALLRQRGAHVTTAASAQEAMNALNGDAPDVLLSDIAMPDEDGYALLRRVKDWEIAHHRRIPAVALTAYASDHDRLQALTAGFAAHLSKPVEPDQLAATLAELAQGGAPSPSNAV